MKEEFYDKNEDGEQFEDKLGNGNMELKAGSYKELVLKVIDGKFLEAGHTIRVTPFSINDKPASHDGKYFFGKENDNNDFNFPKEENVGPNQFEIRFDKNNGLYYIKDIREGSGSFIKINKRQAIEQDSIFSFCNTHIIVYKTKQDNMLRFKFLIGHLKNKVFNFDPKDNKVVRIGRSKQSEVVYKDESVSRFQLSFVYENGKWYICDGMKDKASTNGLWMLASKKVAFHDGMIFKSGNTTFRLSLE
jgi:pSer/pThr/pTyr-binding forkhead associated (FHA) protein